MKNDSHLRKAAKETSGGRGDSDLCPIDGENPLTTRVNGLRVVIVI